jgi:hypothetical protein
MSLVSDAKLDGMVPFKLLPPIDMKLSPVIDPTLEGMVPFKPFAMNDTPVISPFAHVTHAGSAIGLQFLPPHEQGSSLSVLQFAHFCGYAPPPVASKNSCQNLHCAGFTRPQGDSGAVEHDALHAARLGYFADSPGGA